MCLLFGALASSYLADNLGRKLLNIISFLGSAAGLFAVALYQYLQFNDYDLSAYQWTPVVCLSVRLKNSPKFHIPSKLRSFATFISDLLLYSSQAQESQHYVYCVALNTSHQMYVRLFKSILSILSQFN